jgi:hypothetical protein
MGRAEKLTTLPSIFSTSRFSGMKAFFPGSLNSLIAFEDLTWRSEP